MVGHRRRQQRGAPPGAFGTFNGARHCSWRDTRAGELGAAASWIRGIGVEAKENEGGVMGTAAEEQGRGGPATPGGDVARAPMPLRGHFIFDTIHKP